MHLATMWLGICGLAIMAMLMARRVKGAIMVGEWHTSLAAADMATAPQHAACRKVLQKWCCMKFTELQLLHLFVSHSSFNSIKAAASGAPRWQVVRACSQPFGQLLGFGPTAVTYVCACVLPPPLRHPVHHVHLLDPQPRRKLPGGELADPW
jgi:xanthine/uracil/vitamin C permease (AzgA family)